MIYVRSAALTALIAALEFAGRRCEVIGIEQFDVTREQSAAFSFSLTTGTPKRRRSFTRCTHRPGSYVEVETPFQAR